MIDTKLGPMDPADLVYKETRQQIPAGVSVTKTYFHKGEVVKQDVTILMNVGEGENK